MSTHKIEIVKIESIDAHPDADKLGIVKIWGYQVCVGLDSWKEGDLAAYVMPDFMVPIDRSEFAFLDTGKGRSHERVRVKKLRGVLSQGLLAPAPEGLGTSGLSRSIQRRCIGVG